MAISDFVTLKVGSIVAVRVQDRVLPGDIVEVAEKAKMAFLHYKGLSRFHDGFRHCKGLRKPNSGENSVVAFDGDIQQK